MTGRRTPDLYDVIGELCDRTQHRELYMRKRQARYHTTDNAPLLIQLARSAMPSYAQTDSAGRIASSRPASNIDAIDTLNQIHTGAAIWLRALNHPTNGNTIDLVRRLGSLVPTVDHCGRARPIRDNDKPGRPVICCTAHRISADIHRWWVWARIATGWDLPPWQPANTCPACGTRGSIRIRILEPPGTRPPSASSPTTSEPRTARSTKPHDHPAHSRGRRCSALHTADQRLHNRSLMCHSRPGR
jgi:hypothetical protein